MARALAILVIARALPSTEFGYLALGLALVDVFRQFSDLGLEAVTTREVAIARDPRTAGGLVGAALALRFGAAVLGYSALLGAASLLGGRPGLGAIAVVGGLVMTWSVMTSVAVWFQARLRMVEYAWAPVVGAIAGLALILATAGSGLGVRGLALMVVLGESLGAVLALVVLGRRGPRLALELSSARSLLATSWPAAVTQCLIVVYFRVDVMILARLAGPDAVAAYSVPVRITEPFLLVPAAIAASVYGGAAPLWMENRPAAVVRLCRTLAGAALGYAVAVASIVTAAASFVLGWLAPAYASAAPILRVLAWSLPFMAVNMVLTATLNSAARFRTVTLIAAATLVTSLSMNFLLVPRFGAFGAAAATVVTEASNTALQLAALILIVRRGRGYNPPVQQGRHP